MSRFNFSFSMKKRLTNLIIPSLKQFNKTLLTIIIQSAYSALFISLTLTNSDHQIYITQIMAEKLQETRQKTQNAARHQIKNTAASPLGRLISKLKHQHIIIIPQQLELLNQVQLYKNTGVTFDSAIQDYHEFIERLNPKQYITSLSSNGNNTVKQLKLDCSQLPRLNTISFTNGKIKDIKHLKLQKSKLKQVLLNNNQIQFIQKLPAFPWALRQLFLESNKLTTLSFLQSSNIRNLTHLYLSSNKITSVQPLVHADLKQLLELHLSQNQIASISCIGQINFGKLRKLALDKNKITSIEEIYRLDFSKFNWIELSENLIIDFTPILRMQSSAIINIFNIYVQDYFPGIYIRDNKVDKEDLKSIFSNNEKFNCLIEDPKEEQWEELFQKYGRYDNYGQDEEVREEQILQNDTNSFQESQNAEEQLQKVDGPQQEKEISQNQQEI